MAQTNVQAFSGDVDISSNLAVDTNKLFVDSVGNKVGIGTTNPGLPLEVLTGNGANYGLRLRRGSGAAFTDLGHLSTPGTEGLAFNVSDGISTTQEVMRITGTGNVGIGTDTPGHKLDLLTYNAQDGIRVLGGAKFALLTSNLASAAYNAIVGEGDGGIIFSSDNDAFNDSTTKGFVIAPWSTSGASGLKIIENGNVGIGTRNPGGLLDVAGEHGDITSAMVHFRTNRDTNNNGDGNVLKLETGGNRSDVEIFECVSLAGSRFVVKADGNVGIGTVSPPGMMSIFTGATTKCGFSIDRFETGNYRTEFYQGASGLDIKVGNASVAPASVVDIERFSATNSRLRINSPGNLRTDGGVTISSYDDITNAKMIIDTGSRYRIFCDGDNRLIFSTAGGSGTLAATTCLGLNGTNLAVGTPTPSHKLHVAGNAFASGFFNHRQQFSVASGVTTTVVTMPNGCQGHVYVLGTEYVYGAARFAYKAGWMGVLFQSLYNSRLTTWTNNGTNIWARHDRGSTQNIVCRTIHTGAY